MTKDRAPVMNSLYEEPIARLTDCLGAAGLRLVRSFDYRPSRNGAHADCDCPHHGTRYCDCQVAVFLVYGGEGNPATLLMHGHDRRADFSLSLTPKNPIDPALAKRIAALLEQVRVSQVAHHR